VLNLHYNNPTVYPPTENGARLLADAGVEVLLLGTGAGDTYRLEPGERVRIELMPFERGGWKQKVHYGRLLLWVLWHARRWQPDWVYATDPLACPIALALTWFRRVRLVYHEYDAPAPAQSRFMRIVMRARRIVARRADVCALPNEKRAAAFRRDTGRDDLVTVWNCPRRAEVSTEPLQVHAGRLRVLYQGSLVPARVPMAVIDALAMTPAEVSLVLVAFETVGYPGYFEALASRARSLGVGDRLEWVKTVSNRAELMRHCATCDAGLSLMPLASSDINLVAMTGASNKPFDYMACGLPLIVSDLPEWREMYVEPGFALPCNPESPESIAGAWRWLLEHRDEREAMARRARRRIAEDWNFDPTFAPVLSRVAGRPSAGRSLH
jgi:glycosyltransferase involved in cell wall biosynthesis